jgi:uncharacterized protein (DUF58 family)
MLRLYLGEEDLSIHLFVDTSDSMRWGQPPKDAASRSIAGALAYVALAGLDRVSVTGFADQVTARLRPQRGRQSCPRVWNMLGSLGAGPPSAKPGDFRSLLAAPGSLRPGISVIISDFLTDCDLGPVLAALRSARQQVVLLQVLAPQELDPDVTDDVALTDVETKASVEVTVTPALLQSYHAALDDHTTRLMALARAHRALWHRVRSDAPVDLLVMDTFRRIGLLA